MPLTAIPRDPTQRMLRQFAATGVVLLMGLAVWRGLSGNSWSTGAWLGLPALALGGAGLAAPRLLKPFYMAAMLAAFPIGWIMSWGILAMVYYGVFTPLAVAFRLLGRDPLGRRRARCVETYWTPKPAVDNPERYLRQY